MMSVPWLVVEQYRDPDIPGGRVYPEAAWQALFACQVEVRPYQEWARRKWGINPSALVDETLERQRLFLESQYGYPDKFGMEAGDHRTLAFRFINRPGEGVLVSVLGKIHAPSAGEAEQKALSYCNEVKATFPYDYGLIPAFSEADFIHLTGQELLSDYTQTADIAQIRRMEVPVYSKTGSPYLQGLWRTNLRAHEQIWRSLAASPSPVLLNISLRSTVLYEEEQEGLLKLATVLSRLEEPSLNETSRTVLKQWSKDTLEQRLAPWKKFFYLQVHLVSSQTLSEHLIRSIGTTLTLNNKDKPIPGYQVFSPRPDEETTWLKKLRNLDIILSDSYLACPRLSEVADLDEVFEVMRLPYLPPENGFPGMSFAPVRDKRDHGES